MKPVPHWKVYVLLARTLSWLREPGRRGKPSHASVETYTQAVKIVIIAAHFSLRGITQSLTAKKALEIQSRSQRGEKNKRLPNVRRATELKGSTFSVQQDFHTNAQRKGLHGTAVIHEHRNNDVIIHSFIVLKAGWVTFTEQQARKQKKMSHC